jgi:hypothetical protein
MERLLDPRYARRKRASAFVRRSADAGMTTRLVGLYESLLEGRASGVRPQGKGLPAL